LKEFSTRFVVIKDSYHRGTMIPRVKLIKGQHLTMQSSLVKAKKKSRKACHTITGYLETFAF